MGYIKAIIYKTLSVRGVAKIGNTKSNFIKYCWVLFVTVMTFLLLYSTGKLIEDFLKYDLVVQISIRKNDKTTLFPTFSFCHQSPFGPSSMKYWQNNDIISPTQYNKKIREKIKETYPNQYFFYADQRRSYYQHLSINDAIKIGWSQNETFILCKVVNDQYQDIGRGVNCEFNVKSISVPHYFNCFSVTPNYIGAPVMQITLLLRTTSISNTTSEYRKGFVNDVFNELSGIRGVIHNRDTFPDIEEDGFNIELGKVLQINYEPIRIYKKHTPLSPCSKKLNQTVSDLNIEFNYTQRSCFQSFLGKLVTEKCNCYFADGLRDGIPNSTVPYCGRILDVNNERLMSRLKCVQKYRKYVNKITGDLYRTTCLPKCKDISFRIKTSITKWLPQNWQIAALLDMSKSWESREVVDKYVNIDDLYQYTSGENFESDNFVLVIINRQNFDTIEQKEILSLDLYNLISRFGGLCSLCLGVTCAFVLEIIEIIYLACQERLRLKEQLRNNKNENVKLEDNQEIHPIVKVVHNTNTSDNETWSRNVQISSNSNTNNNNNNSTNNPRLNTRNRNLTEEELRDFEVVFKFIDREYPFFLSSL